MKIPIDQLKEPETILIYASAKVGKSFAYCSIMERCLQAGHNVFIINTDKGFLRTAIDYFGKERLDTYINQIHYYFITHIDDMSEVIHDIKQHVTQHDMIVIDLLSTLWELAQYKFVENLSGGDITNYYEQASRDKAKFGTLNGDKWQYVKALHNYFANRVIVSPPCMVVGVCAMKELTHDKLHDNKEVMDKYELIGAKPGGAPRIDHDFNTIIKLGEFKRGKERIHYMQVIGDRGKFVDYTRINYGRDFWDTFVKYREGVDRT